MSHVDYRTSHCSLHTLIHAILSESFHAGVVIGESGAHPRLYAVDFISQILTHAQSPHLAQRVS
ncbi:hypothetical protein IEQ34_005486 [Dendrobium chrysotoxum]|uniref:Uncharacterized protein n=1 Tax=Dendrobium chrysotoxum TaxID=161865 RepID=A0AAV7HCS8_DENCH|nr:hypothetical protein IEQ34_005486 [Dendrobium chrysotoxum]